MRAEPAAFGGFGLARGRPGSLVCPSGRMDHHKVLRALECRSETRGRYRCASMHTGRPIACQRRRDATGTKHPSPS